MVPSKLNECYAVFDHIVIDKGIYKCIPKSIAIRKSDISVIRYSGQHDIRLANNEIYRWDAYVFKIICGNDNMTVYNVSVNEIDTVQKMIKYINEYEDSSME